MDATVTIGVPADSVGRGGGAERGPAVLRSLGLPAALVARDRGDLAVRIRGEERDPDSGLIAAADVLASTVTIRAAVAAAVDAGERPFLIGGCHELPGALATLLTSLTALDSLVGASLACYNPDKERGRRLVGALAG